MYTDQDNLFDEANVIYRYTRQNLIDDGLLIEVPESLSREAGIKFPVGILSEVWESCVSWDEEANGLQDQTGRLWDILNVLREAARRGSGDTVYFTVACIPRDGKSAKPENIALKCVIGPGDDPKPVLTIMLPDQD